MEIINISNYNETRFNTGVALGNFDGIHLGHQELINVMVKESKKLGLKSSLLLFKGHTRAIVGANQPKIITTNEQKFRIAKELGVDLVYIMDFDKSIMKLSGEEFIKNIVIDKMNSKLLVIGFDYKFGHKAYGNSNLLLELGKKHNIEVRVLEAITNDGEIIGSTEIRNLIAKGNISKANTFLGRPYSIVGTVIQGSNRGNKLGFPTANIKTDSNIVIPKSGVYKTNTILNGQTYMSATNIGYNPTFSEEIFKIESHILDFNQDIYGESIEIEFLDFLRDDIKFKTKEDLIDQMNMDIKRIQNKH